MLINIICMQMFLLFISQKRVIKAMIPGSFYYTLIDTFCKTYKKILLFLQKLHSFVKVLDKFKKLSNLFGKVIDIHGKLLDNYSKLLDNFEKSY